jgi:DNA-binding response OmpR family regulator
MRILIVEDEPRMLDLLRKGLYEHGHTIMTAADGEAGLEIASSFEFDAIVLDIGLPLLNGYELIKALRVRARSMPVLMLTARDTEDDIICGLVLGADDYLTKPFSFPELIARLQAITRPKRTEFGSVLEVADVVVDPSRHSVTRNRTTVDLTRHEFQLLTCLMRKAGQCIPRQTLMDSIWGADQAVGASALDVLVNALRAKIDAPFHDKLIGTVRGGGYVFRLAASSAEGTS